GEDRGAVARAGGEHPGHDSDRYQAARAPRLSGAAQRACGGTTMSLSPELKQRVLASVADVPAPTRSQVLRTRAWLFACGIVGALAIFFLEGGMRVTTRPPSLVALTSLGTAVIVGVGMWFLFTGGGSVLGRAGSRLLVAALASSVLFVAWRYRVSAIYGLTEAWPERPGFRCLGLSIL